MNSEEDTSDKHDESKNNCDLQNIVYKRNYHPRRVSFPENDTDLVTGYLEPVNPFRLAVNVNKSELLHAYQLSCERHNTDPIRSVFQQIKEFNIGDERINTFNLNKVTLTCSGCESLEEIFKRVQFVKIDLTHCGLLDDTAFALFEMFEYYESAIHLNLSNNANLGVRGWQACARYLKKSNTLEELETRDICLTETEADCLLKPLSLNRYLQILKLENCNLNGNSMRSLVNALTNNKTLKELYLADNKIGIFEATLMGTLLKLNKTLQVLDLSNNQIQDTGLNHLVIGLCSQAILNSIEMLILWNNHLTSLCSSYVESLLRDCRSLTMINIGCNNLEDEFILTIKNSLKKNQNVQRLGLQATGLTCQSALSLEKILRINISLQRIDLRENDILCPGLEALSNCMDMNKNVIQVDLNDKSTSADNPEKYMLLVEEINKKCHSNKERVSTENETTVVIAPRVFTRKISLTCQTLLHHEIPPLLTEPKKVNGKLRSPAPSPAPSPIPSPVSSPVPPSVTKSRFSVSRVEETTNCQSRFTVAPVTDSCQPPEPIMTSSRSITMASVSNTPEQQFQPVNGCKNEEQNRSVDIVTANENVKTNSRPLSSIEKLLSIFQPPPIFTAKIQSAMTISKQCDSEKYLPFSNSNLNKVTFTANGTNIYSADTPKMNSELLKENISPNQSQTESSVKKVSKNELNCSPCALDNNDKELKNGNDSNSLASGDGNVCKQVPLPLCSSSEDSDSGCSGMTAFDSAPGNSTNVTDSGSIISDDSAASFENTSTPSVQSPASESDHLEISMNNKWRSTVAVSTIFTDSNTDHN